MLHNSTKVIVCVHSNVCRHTHTYTNTSTHTCIYAYILQYRAIGIGKKTKVYPFLEDIRNENF